jgi:hypothetical protein
VKTSGESTELPLSLEDTHLRKSPRSPFTPSQKQRPTDADSATTPAREAEPSTGKPEGGAYTAKDQGDAVGRAGGAENSEGFGVPANHSRPLRREIGRLSLQWHSGNGEYGRMDNVIAAYEPAERSAEVDLQIAAVPRDIRVQEPFGARCIARNNSENPIRLYLQVRRDLVGEIVPVGTSGVSLGEVRPASTAECLLTFLPLTSGLHSLSGVRVVNIDSRESFDADAPVISVI